MPDSVTPGSSAEKPPLLEAIQLTMGTVERRKRFYRVLVIVFSLTAIAPVVLAIILRNWVPLSGWALLPLWIGGFILVDQRIVKEWRYRVIRIRDERGLQVNQLEEILSGIGHLPQATLKAMLRLLQSTRANRA